MSTPEQEHKGVSTAAAVLGWWLTFMAVVVLAVGVGLLAGSWLVGLLAFLAIVYVTGLVVMTTNNLTGALDRQTLAATRWQAQGSTIQWTPAPQGTPVAPTPTKRTDFTGDPPPAPPSNISKLRPRGSGDQGGG